MHHLNNYYRRITEVSAGCVIPKSFLTILFLTCALVGSAQQGHIVAPQVIASSGTHLSSGDIQMDFTMAEFMVMTLGADPRLTQGFHQPGLEGITRVIDPLYADLVTVFPNPVSDVLKVRIDTEGILDLGIYNIHGQLVYSQRFREAADISLHRWTPGFYGLQLSKDGLNVFITLFERL